MSDNLSNSSVRPEFPGAYYNFQVAPRFTYSEDDKSLSFWVWAFCRTCGHSFPASVIQDVIWDADLHYKSHPECLVGQHTGDIKPDDSWIKPAWRKFMSNYRRK